MASDERRRRSIRLPGHDYADPGYYAVTLVTAGRAPILGVVHEGSVGLSPVGRIVRDEWLRTPSVRPNVSIDAWVIMPNHLHGIVVIDDRFDGRRLELPIGSDNGRGAFRTQPHTLGAIVRGFKAATTRRINELRGMPDAPVWQRNYYEHVVRDDRDLDRARAYIEANPYVWERDDEYMDDW